MSLFLEFIQIVYFMLPVYLANMTPVLVRKVKFLNYPLDFNKKIFGKRIFGDHKTFRGLVFGVGAALIVFWIQKRIGIDSIIKYQEYGLYLGFLLGFGALAGDAIKSFFKRMYNVKEGKPWVPFDQIDFVLGTLLLTFFVVDYTVVQVIIIIAISMIGHILVNHTAYFLGIREVKW